MMGLAIAIAPGSARAQVDTAADYTGGVRFGLGAGGASLDGADEGAVVVRAGMTVPLGHRTLVSLRASVAEEVTLFAAPEVSVWDVAVMIGRQAKTKGAYGSIAAGIALTEGVRRTRLPANADCALLVACLVYALLPDYAEQEFSTVGIAVELEAGLTFTSVVGLGVTAFGNLNDESTTMGLSLGVVIGDLR
jgi:hypothetical protein